MEIQREYETKKELAKLIEEKASANEDELDRVLSDFNSLSTMQTKRFIDKIQINTIISELKNNNIKVMQNFAQKLKATNEDFSNLDVNIAKEYHE